MLNRVAIIAEQAFVGAKPNATLLVLNKTVDNGSIGIEVDILEITVGVGVTIS